MQDDNAKLLKKFQQILKELTFHAKEPNCNHPISQFLDKLEFEND
jgi:hypothetical protein